MGSHPMTARELAGKAAASFTCRSMSGIGVAASTRMTRSALMTELMTPCANLVSMTTIFICYRPIKSISTIAHLLRDEYR